MYQLKYFLDQSFDNYDEGLLALGNTEEEKQNIKAFMDEMYEKTANGTVAFPPILEGGDSVTMGYACEVLKWFKPAVLFVNLSGVDGCHSNFTSYLQAMHRADHAVGHLWDFIQNEIPDMAGDTTLIVTPECGRNDNPNNIIDENNWRSYDHSDENSLRVFSMMAGPDVPSNLIVGSENNQIGQVTDTMMTVADILGVLPEVQAAGHTASGTQSLFNHI